MARAPSSHPSSNHNDAPANISDPSAQEEILPPITWNNWWKEVYWFNALVLILTPVLSLWGLFYVPMRWQTILFATVYFQMSQLGVTAGYHRLWAHRSYNATVTLQYILAILGASSVEGSIRYWCRGHRAHHRYTDTDLDPYSAHKGIIFSHIGWVMVRPRRKPGTADMSDLHNNTVVQWQDRHFLLLIFITALVVPVFVPGLGWGDPFGGFIYAGMARLVCVHHSTFCVNSLAHYLGDVSYDDKHSPRDHFITAFLTMGEGYHNFHHQFPMDYRNAIKWYQYDPTKWLIWAFQKIGLASHLKVFPDNEIRKAQLTIELKRLRETQTDIKWPTDSNDLPVISWDSFQEQSLERPLVLVSGFIHDISTFLDAHPGGRQLLAANIGKDASAAFFGGVYNHSNAAHNLLAMMRVGVLHGGQPHANDEKAVPPSQKLRIMRFDEYRSIPSQ